MKKMTKEKGKEIFASYFMLIVLVLTFVVFGAINKNFFNVTNVLDIVRTASIVGILGMGGSFVSSTGDTNFAVGTQATLAAAILGILMQYVPDQLYWVAILVPILLSGLLAWCMAKLAIKLNISIYLTTLTLESVITGFARYLTNNQVLFSSKWGKNVTLLGQTNLFGVIPVPAILFFVIAVFAHIYKEKTRAGRYNFAAGANAITAKQVGIDVNKEKVKAMTVCGFFCGFAGVMLLSVFDNVNMTMGTYYKFPGICATVLSAAFWKIGRYNIPGSVISAILIIAIQNGVITIGGSFYYKEIVQGALLLIALIIVAAIREDGLPKVSFTNE